MPTGQGSEGEPAAIAFRVPLPDSAIGRVDSAELRMTCSGSPVRSWPMTVGDSALQADLVGWEPGPAEFAVFAYAGGTLAYYGTATWDPARTGSAQVSVSLGPVGRVRIDARFGEGGID